MRGGIPAELAAAISRLRAEKPFPLIAVDGRCASGKTTLAAQLAAETGCSVLHMDHFFLRPEQRTQERLAQPGGNVDRERFLEEALLPLRRGVPFAYRPYECGRLAFGEPGRTGGGPFSIVEGSYSCHPALWDFYDLQVFLTVSPEEQLRRIRARNGEAGAAPFQERWIPLEERYFEAFSVAERCELCLNMERD